MDADRVTRAASVAVVAVIIGVVLQNIGLTLGIGIAVGIVVVAYEAGLAGPRVP